MTSCSRCRLPRYGSTAKLFPRWRRPGSSASPMWSIVRARRWPRGSGRNFSAGSIRRWAGKTNRSSRGCRCRLMWRSGGFADPIMLEADVLGSHRAAGARTRASSWNGVGRARGCCRPRYFAPTAKSIGSNAGTGEPLRDPARIHRLFAERLMAIGDACDPGFGYDLMRLSALITEQARSGANRTCRQRPQRRTRTSDRPVERAFRVASRDAAAAVRHPYSRIRGGRDLRRRPDA